MKDLSKKEHLKKIKNMIAEGHGARAFMELKGMAEPSDDFVMQCKYGTLFSHIPHDDLGLSRVKLAILPSSTVSHFKEVLRFWLAIEGFLAEVYEAEYDTIAQKILDDKSDLYKFGPDITMIFTNYRDIKCNVSPGAGREDVDADIIRAVDQVSGLWARLKERADTYIIQNNADLPYQRMLGNYEGTAAWGCLNVLRGFNAELARKATPGVTILDMDYISSVYGKKKWHDMPYWYHSKHAFAPDATGLVAHDAARVIAAVRSAPKKCLVFDLDNTIWGGVIGDDGVDGIKIGNGADGEAFLDFQRYMLDLKKRGIMLAVASKNDDQIAREPFEKRPEMLMKLDDILVFRANWDDKASNIRAIAEELNIGLDSIVFVDDNPAERALVRSMLPMVSVPEMPEDPALYIDELSGRSYFETVSFSREDANRSELYRSNSARSDFKQQFTTLDEYLAGLDMKMDVGGPPLGGALGRITQLINKSNQFNLTTIRYTEPQIDAISRSGHIIKYFRLVDKFGDNGIISVVIMKKDKDAGFCIDTWVMSCRVLSRGVEEFIMNELSALAKAENAKKITGRYIPTKKNQLVASLYQKLGFVKKGEDGQAVIWEMALDKVPEYKSAIKKI